MNSFNLDESSEPLISLPPAADVGGVDRLGVLGREGGLEPCGVAVVDGAPDDGAAEAMLTVAETDVHAAVALCEWDVAGPASADVQHEICSRCCTGDSVGGANACAAALSRTVITVSDAGQARMHGRTSE